MVDFLNFQDTAAVLISENGGPVAVTKPGASNLDPVTDTATDAPVSLTFQAVAFPPSQQARFKVGNLEGRNVMEVYFSLKGQASRPAPGDKVALADGDYTIFYAQTFEGPGGTAPIMTVAYAER